MNVTTPSCASAPPPARPRPPTPRLPAGDHTTRQAETAVFASLGLAALLMILMALVEAHKFVAGSSQIAAALNAKQKSLAAAPPAPEGKIIATNAVVPGRRPAGTPATSPDKV